jgi:hypothetical protein
VRYKVRPEHLAAHEALIRDVFQALAALQPAGFHYQAVKLADGLSFQHVAAIAEGVPHPLRELPAFRAFQEGIAQRCEIQPATEEVTELGFYA